MDEFIIAICILLIIAICINPDWLIYVAGMIVLQCFAPQKRQILGGGDSFPYKSTYLKQTPEELFANLKAHSAPLFAHTDREIKLQADKLYRIDVITDLFSEEQRVKVQVYGNLSPMQYWQANQSALRKYSLEAQRENIYKNAREATTFKPSLSKFIYDTYLNEPGHVLDPCAGWGDRLIGALASDKVLSYTATDTNTDMQLSYARIINTLTDTKCKAQVNIMDFFKFKSDIKYNLVFTSPPFYDFEMYNNMQVPKTYAEWLNDWLIPFVAKCLMHCAFRGKVMLYLGNTYRTPNMVETIQNKFGAKIIQVYNLPKPRPLQLLVIENLTELKYLDEITDKQTEELFQIVSKPESRKIYVLFDGLLLSKFKEIFANYEVHEISDQKQCDLNNQDVFMFLPIGKYYYGITPTNYKSIEYKSRLSVDITNKKILHENNKMGLAETYSVDTDDIRSQVQANPKTNWIARPLDGYSGQGIYYMNVANMNKILPKLNNKYIVSKMVASPYLINGHKIHIRKYAIISDINDKISFKMIKQGLIAYATEPYSAKLTKAVQDTHFGGREMVKYPDDFPDQDYIPQLEQKLDEIIAKVMKTAKIKKYPDANVKNAFEILALDILIDTHDTSDKSKWDVILVEINHKPGFVTSAPEKNKEYGAHRILGLKYTEAEYADYMSCIIFTAIKEIII